MKKNSKKIISVALTVILALMLTISAFAVSLDEAKDIAVKDAGVVALRFTEANLDEGKYDIEFQALDGEYDYEITKEGKILSMSVEYFDVFTSKEKKLSADEAKAKAFGFYGKTDVRAVSIEYDLEDNDYEVKFIDGAKRYDIEVSAYDGDITAQSYELVADGNESLAGLIALIEEIINFKKSISTKSKCHGC